MESSYHENYIKQLQRLLHTVAKSEKKLIDASDHIVSEEYKNLIDKYAEERIIIISELQEAIAQLGGTHTNVESEIGIHHPITGLGTMPNSKKEQSILEQVRNSERDALETYDDVLQGSILEEFNLKTLLMGHRLAINEAFTELDKRYFALFKLSEPY
ncbi:DUF2383 domain-containing protein [Pedobacter sp. P351]|uniref:DUF2383 domain-containing protein n=1 Tax=Pedobacter superstes TaxID=3133441 RepID=UPI0030A55D18